MVGQTLDACIRVLDYICPRQGDMASDVSPIISTDVQ